MRRFVIIVSMMILLSACSGNYVVSTPESIATTISEEYRIGVSDTLDINVWRNNELSISVPVRPDGRVSMPLIGDIDAAGKTSMGLAGDITNKLEKFVRNPQVTVIVTNPSSTDFQRRVRITGSVNAPQSVAYRDGMTVLDLVLLAGGVSDFASANSAKLYRKDNDSVKLYPIFLDDILEQGKLKTNYPLAPSDIITVPERLF